MSDDADYQDDEATGNEEPFSWVGAEQSVEIDLSNPSACVFDGENVHVELAEGVVLRGGYSAVRKIGSEIVEHLRQRDQYGRQHPTVSVQIDKVAYRLPNPAVVQMTTRGTIHGRDFEFRSRARRRQTRSLLSTSFGILPLILAAVEASRETRKSPLQFCLEECTADISVQLDREANHADGLASLVYRTVNTWQWGLALLMVVYVVWSHYISRPNAPPLAILVLMPLAGFPTLFFVQSLLGLLMPKSFFQTTPLGRRECARQNITSFMAYRLKNLFQAVVFGGVIFLLLGIPRV